MSDLFEGINIDKHNILIKILEPYMAQQMNSETRNDRRDKLQNIITASVREMK